MSMKVSCIFVIFGNTVDEDLSNMKTINTRVIPNIGDTIVVKNDRYLVHNRLIYYSNVEGYELNDPDRGSEVIFIYVNK